MSCIVTNDKYYLGEDQVHQFDALIFKIRFFKSNEKGNNKKFERFDVHVFCIMYLKIIIMSNLFLARAAVPDKRSPHQRYILETHESSRAENIPPFVNAEYMST